MCFIKPAIKYEVNPFSNINVFMKNENQYIHVKRQEDIVKIQNFQIDRFGKNYLQNFYQNQLLELLGQTLKRNSETFESLHKQIEKCEQKLTQLDSSIQKTAGDEEKRMKISQSTCTLDSLPEQRYSTKQQKSSNQLTTKIFGDKSYTSRLVLNQEFPSTIYKQRNLKINLALQDRNGKPIKNVNLINLCLSLVDDRGNWVNLNRVGDPMLKGKTYVQLYHGEADFNKIYTKDISRTYSNGKLSIVVYARPSSLVYNGRKSDFQEFVDANSIEPLMINDITIKAKKK